MTKQEGEIIRRSIDAHNWRVQHGLPNPALPTTEAGKALLDRESLNSRSFALVTPEAVLAIEAEATAATEQRLRADIEALPSVVTGFDWPKGKPLEAYPLHAIDRAAVLALLARQGEPDAGNPDANHYDWFMPDDPTAAVDDYLDDFEAKLTESLTDPFVHDMAHSVLPLIAAYRAARAASPRQGEPVDVEQLDRALGSLEEDDLDYDYPVAMSGEPLDPVLFVRYDALRAALSEPAEAAQKEETP